MVHDNQTLAAVVCWMLVKRTFNSLLHAQKSLAIWLALSNAIMSQLFLSQWARNTKQFQSLFKVINEIARKWKANKATFVPKTLLKMRDLTSRFLNGRNAVVIELTQCNFERNSIINMTKLLDSDWLTSVHFFFSTQCQKDSAQMHFTHRNLAFDWLLNNRVW